MIGDDGAWLPTVWLGIPAVVLGVALCLLAIYGIRCMADDAAEFWLLAWIPIAGILALIVFPAFGYWPYDGDYHRLQPVTGTVAAVDTRFMAASQYVVVTYREGATVRCDDSRCSTVEVGDRLRLLCTREFEYGAVNGWGCRWGQL